MARQGIKPPGERDYDERVYHRGFFGPSNLVIGLAALAVLILGTYIAFAKTTNWFPFAPQGREVRAVFDNALTLRPDSPVRIAGVNVGQVTSVTRLGEQADVHFTVSEEGQPLHEDATVKIRPRLFLEGNFFLDLHPGSPTAPELEDDEPIPVTQTSEAVQFDQVLTSLQKPYREDLVELLEGFGTALTHEPSEAEDADQDPDVQGETAAEALNDSFEYGGDAGRGTAIVNEALLGTEPHDLSRLIRATGKVSRALIDREAELQDLVTNFNVTSGAFAAESANLSESIRLLAPAVEETGPALRRLDTALPPLRRLAIEAVPGFRELPGTIAVSGPWLDQTAALLRESELGGLARLARRSTPNLARATVSGAALMPEIERFSRCVTEVLVPTGDIVIDDAFSTGQPNFREFFYGAVNQAGESQNFDGNGQYVRVNAGGGPVEARTPFSSPAPDNFLYSNLVVEQEGTQPVITSPPPVRGDVPCHRNAVPDLNGIAAAVGPPSPEATSP